MNFKPILIAAAVLSILTGCRSKSDDSIFSLQEFRNPGIDYRSKPFWSLNDSLDTDEMRRQLEVFKDAGYGGAFLHSRLGLLTPYLSDEWFHAMDEGVKACQDLGIEAWFYDEDKWPSGFAGGIVPRQSDSYRSRSLLRVPAGTEINPEDKVLYEDDRYMYVEFVDRMGQSWYNGTCWVDLMNPETVKAFIDCSYEPYIKRYAGKPFVKGIFFDEAQVTPRPGDYANTDAALPYSPVMEGVFKEMWGYDLDPVLPSLLDTVGDWRKVRLHYYRTIARCMEEAFSRQLGEYCGKNDFILTGHFNGEEMASANMKNEGNLQYQLRNLQAPGVDALGLKYKNNHNDRIMTSTANQYGQKRRLVEIFGISGHNLSFEERMWVLAWHTNSGANLMCPHLSLYSMKGERKRDYPPTFSYQQSYFEKNRLFEDFSSRLCYFATVGKTVGQACVISSIESDYIVNGPKPIDYGTNTYSQTERIIEAALATHTNIDIADEGIIEEIGSVSPNAFVVGQMAYTTVIVPHLYTLRPSTLEKIVEFGRNGGCVLVVKDYPEFIEGAVDEAAIAELKSVSTLIENDRGALRAALEERADGLRVSGEKATKVMTHLRDIKGGRTAQISNTSPAETILVDVEMTDVPEGNITVILDPLDGRCLSFENGTSLELAPSQTYILASMKKADIDRIDGKYAVPCGMEPVQVLAAEMKGRRLGPNSLVLDFAEWCIDDCTGWKAAEPVLAIYKRTQTEIYDGPMSLRYSFDVQDIPEQCSLAVEQPWIYSSISVNGTEIEGWNRNDWFVDKVIRCHDVTSLVKEGKNTVVLSLEYKSPRVASSNSVERYGTEIESIFLVGDFAVNGKLAAKQPVTSWRNTAPRLAPKPLPSFFENEGRVVVKEKESFSGNLTLEGYPFYAGAFEYETSFRLDGKQEAKRYTISFPEVQAILVDATLNGKELNTVFCSPWEMDVTEALAEGDNDLKITVTGSLRNVMGPFHNVGGEFHVVGPSTFMGGDEWPNVVLGDKDWYEKRKTGNTILWRDGYYCIPFGLLNAPVLNVEK